MMCAAASEIMSIFKESCGQIAIILIVFQGMFFMKRIVKHLDNVRVGAILMRNYPNITLPINEYSINELE